MSAKKKLLILVDIFSGNETILKNYKGLQWVKIKTFTTFQLN